MATDDHWTIPGVWPTQSPTNQDHGGIEYTGVDIVEHFHNFAASVKGQQFKGITYHNAITGNLMPTFESVNLEDYNNYLRWIYFVYRKLRRFELFCTGLAAGTWIEGSLLQGDGFTNPVEVYQFAASGSGTLLNLSWAEGAPDIRSLGRTDGTPACANSGMFMIDQRFPLFSGISEIIDIELTGGLNAAVTLHPSKPLNPANSGGFVWIILVNLLGGFPIPRLHIPEAAKKEPPQCAFARRQQCSIYSSFKAKFPDLPMAQAIDSQGFMCTKMNLLNQFELDGFEATSPRCNFTACRFYEAHIVTMPSPSDIYKYLVGRGEYVRRLVFGGGGGANLRYGRIGFAGLWGLHDVFLYPSVQESIENQITYSAQGALKFDTGENDENGFRKYQTFREIATERADGSDDIGLVSISTPGVSKQSPDGGVSPVDKSISPTYPSAILSEAAGIRRSGSVSMSQLASPSGIGEDDVQRAMRKAVYTSPGFTLPIAIAIIRYSRDSETRIETFTSGQAGEFPITNFIYDLTFRIPKQGDTVMNARETTLKVVGGLIVTASFVGGLLTLDLFLGEEISSYPIPGTIPVQTGFSNWDVGGNVVAQNAALTITNGVTVRTSNTDPQKLIYPGDVITVLAEGLEGVGAMVVEATANGGPQQANARAPNPLADGIPEALIAVGSFQDRIVLKLQGSTGEKWQEFFEAGGFDGGDVALDQVGHVGIAPVRDSYKPGLELIGFDGTETVIPEEAYRFDPVDGTFYVQTAGLPDGDFRLAFTGHVFDTRRTLPISNPSALHALSTNFADGFIQGSPTVSSLLELTLKDSSEGERSIITHWDVYGQESEFVTYDIPFLGMSDATYDAAGNAPLPFRESRPLFALRVPSGISLKVGAEPVSVSDQEDNLIQGFDYVLRTPLSVFSLGGTPYGANDIRKVTVNFEYVNPEHWEKFGQWTKADWDANGNSQVWWDDQYTTQLIDTPNLSLAVVVLEPDGVDFDVLYVGTTDVISTTKTTVEGNVILRGTADISDQYKVGLELVRSGGGRFMALMPAGPFAIISESSLEPINLIRSWINTWVNDVDFNDPLPPPGPGWVWSSQSVHYAWVELDSFSASGIQIQFVDAQLETGADPYAGPDAVEALPPDLMAEPQE